MIQPKNIIKILKDKGIKFFAGVPDSTLKGLISELMITKGIILRESFNEGNAVASAIGYNISTSKIPFVYMQNSGLTNALNPFLTLAEKKPLYSIPMIFFIGWRGFKGASNKAAKQDEPQHSSIGPVTPNLLKVLKIKTVILDEKKYKKQISGAVIYAKKNSRPIAFLVKRKLLKMYEPKKTKKIKTEFKRIDFLKSLFQIKNKNDILVGTTGYSAREIYALTENTTKNHSKTFYSVGAMGHASQISAELAYFSKIKSRVLMIDGDGAAFMHLGSIPMIGKLKKINLVHIIVNNQTHESTGNHNTSNINFSFKKMFEISGYDQSYVVKNPKDFNKIIQRHKKGKIGIEILVNSGTLGELPRQKEPYILKKIFKF